MSCNKKNAYFLCLVQQALTIPTVFFPLMFYALYKAFPHGKGSLQHRRHTVSAISRGFQHQTPPSLNTSGPQVDQYSMF